MVAVRVTTFSSFNDKKAVSYHEFTVQSEYNNIEIYTKIAKPSDRRLLDIDPTIDIDPRIFAIGLSLPLWLFLNNGPRSLYHKG